MTQTIAEDANNDMYLDGKGNLTVQQDTPDTIGTLCKSRLQTVLGEMPLSVNTGINYDRFVWVGSPEKGQIDLIFRRTITNTEQVLQIIKFVSVISNNTYSYGAVIATEYGETILAPKPAISNL
jgi:hypothetical protein